MKEISAIINARIGSTRVKSKMIRDYSGTSLIDIALEKIDKCNFFSFRFLAAHESELTDKLKKFKNIELLSRKKESVIPGPHPPLITFEHYTRLPTDIFFVINPCCAMLSLDTIKKAYEYIQETNYISYISAEKNRDWIFSNSGEPLTHKDSNAFQNTSDGEYRLKVNHVFYASSKSRFIKDKGKLWSLKKDDPHLIEIEEYEAIDVDSELDFQFSEFYFKSKNKL